MGGHGGRCGWTPRGSETGAGVQASVSPSPVTPSPRPTAPARRAQGRKLQTCCSLCSGGPGLAPGWVWMGAWGLLLWVAHSPYRSPRRMSLLSSTFGASATAFGPVARNRPDFDHLPSAVSTISRPLRHWRGFGIIRAFFGQFYGCFRTCSTGSATFGLIPTTCGPDGASSPPVSAAFGTENRPDVRRSRADSGRFRPDFRRFRPASGGIYQIWGQSRLNSDRLD